MLTTLLAPKTTLLMENSKPGLAALNIMLRDVALTKFLSYNLCYFRRLQCHDCVELKKEVKNINQKMTEDLAIIKKQVDDHNAKIQKQIDDQNVKIQKCVDDHNAKIQKQIDDQNVKFLKCVDDVNEKINKMYEIQTEMMVKVTQIMTEVKQLKQIIPDQQLVRKNIIIAGGENPKRINSVEIFSWTHHTWTLIKPMSICRSRASAVTYKDEVIISGGGDGEKSTDTIETSSCDQAVEWKISPVKIPEVRRSHATVLYKDSLLLSGGNYSISKTSNKIYAISMVPPYSSKILTTMPETRCDHTMELFEDKLFIFGGYNGGTCDTVMMFDLTTKEWKMMTPLPFEVDEMATVLWQNNVIVLGGRPAKDSVVMYNLTTGQSKYLPPMKHKRLGCTAVVTGDVLVVMGGRDGRNYLKSVEVFDLKDQVWEELPDMNESRCYASAVVKPS